MMQDEEDFYFGFVQWVYKVNIIQMNNTNVTLVW